MDLLRDYMNEHYSAARNQQTMRLQAMALYVSASAIMSVQAILNFPKTGAVIAIGLILVVLGCICFLQNRVFHRTNRYHVEVARNARKQLTKILNGGQSLAQNDPNLIGEVVRANSGARVGDELFEQQLKEAHQKLMKSNPFKVEGLIHRSLYIIPILIGLAGLLLILLKIGNILWIGKFVCTVCNS